jgi:hypothetical protein
MARTGHDGPEIYSNPRCAARDRCRARRHVEPGEDVRDVPMDRVLAEAEPFGDGLVAQTRCDQPDFRAGTHEQLQAWRASGRIALGQMAQRALGRADFLKGNR